MPEYKITYALSPAIRDSLTDSLKNINKQPFRMSVQAREELVKLKNLIHLILNRNSDDNKSESSISLSAEEYFEVDRHIKKLTNNLTFNNITPSLKEEISNISKAWKDALNYQQLDSYNSNNLLEGKIRQLTTRQEEINSKAKGVLDEITESASVALSRLSRQSQKQLNQIKMQAQELQSDVVNQVEASASNSKIELQEESSRLKRELLEEIRDFTENSIDAKQVELYERTDAKVKSVLETVEREVSNLQTRVNKEVEEFCILNEALRRTLNYVASDALADSSVAQAEREKDTADSLRAFGVAWLIISIGLFLLTFDYSKLIDEHGVPQYTLILLRSFFLIVGITPGFYLLRESARHRTDERRYRQKGIQLATIDGYFAGFDDIERNSVKRELSKHYFHGTEHFIDTSSVDNVQSKYDQIFDKIVSSKRFK